MRSRLLSKFYLTIFCGTCLMAGLLMHSDLKKKEGLNQSVQLIDPSHAMKKTAHQRYLIVWRYQQFISYRLIKKEDATALAFISCEYKNCDISLDANDAHRSDAVIFPIFFASPKLMVNRTNKQIWILYEYESPDHLKERPLWKRSPLISSFNWSMTYDSTNADIFFPYGELRRRSKIIERNYTALASNKKHGALMISSHCYTNGLRDNVVATLQKYIPVTVLGKCGDKWDCGKRFVHNECFEVINEYRYFLDFENSLCRHYFTEKLFENFKYDTVIVIRGGLKGDAKEIFPNGTFISTDDFESIKSLGNYLKNLSVEEYADILKRKDQYFNIGYPSIYKRAMCDVCKRMNNQDKFRNTIQDTFKWMYSSQPCRNPDDFNDIFA